MTDENSGNLLARWQKGDQHAAAELFRRYADRLIALARSRLSRRLSQRVDPEDVVQSVYRSFFDGAREGRYDLQRGGDLWRLLLTITLNKLHHQIKRNRAGKRAVQREQPFGDDDGLLEISAERLARTPAPIEAVMLADQLEQLARSLPPLSARVLELRLQGCNLDEIMAETRRSERTVYRILEEIKAKLVQQHMDCSNS